MAQLQTIIESEFSKHLGPSDGTALNKKKSFNFEDSYPPCKSTILHYDGSKPYVGILTIEGELLKKLEKEAAIVAQREGIKTAVLKKIYVNDLDHRRGRTEGRIIREEDLDNLFLKITSQLQPYQIDEASVSRDMLYFCNLINAFKPSADYSLNKLEGIIKDVDLWCLGSKTVKSALTVVRELARPVPENKLEKNVKKILRKKVQTALQEQKLKNASDYLQILFGATLTYHKSDEPGLCKILSPAIDQLSIKSYEPLAVAVAMFFAGATLNYFRELRDKYKRIDSVRALQSKHGVIREALR